MYKPQNIYLFKVNNEKIDNVIDNRKRNSKGPATTCNGIIG